jgi:hypothetical protein
VLAVPCFFFLFVGKTYKIDSDSQKPEPFRLLLLSNFDLM